MKVLRQLLREFLLPLILAIGWTAYNLKSTPQSAWTVSQFVNVFGPTFFFLSWLSAQWFRVRKQQKVESDLGGIDAAVRQSIARLEQTSDHLVGHITGGDSFCHLEPPPPDPNHWAALTVLHSGKFPLYDVRARLHDLDQPLPDPFTVDHLFSGDQQIDCGDLIPGHAKAIRMPLDFDERSRIRLNIFFSARNGGFTQLFRCVQVAGTWESALQVRRDSEILLERVTDAYPRAGDGTVAWDA